MIRPKVAARRIGRRCRSWIAVALPLLSIVVSCTTPAPPFPEVSPRVGDAGAELELPADEREIWEEAKKFVKYLEEEEQEIGDPVLESYFDRVLGNLDPEFLEGPTRIRVRVFEDVNRNASALPNGQIIISTSLLATLDNEAQFAFLLGHEIAHVRFRHALLSRRYEKTTPSHVYRMRLSRRLESDADQFGINGMVAAGYSPGEALAMLQHLGDGPSPFAAIDSWSSHLPLSSRLRHLQLQLHGIKRQPERVDVEEYQAAIDAIRLRAAEIEIDEGSLDKAEAFVSHHLKRRPQSGRAFLLRGQITRKSPSKSRKDPSIRSDLERAVELAPDDPNALRALGLLLMDSNDLGCSRCLLERYLAAAPDAVDRKLIERYLDRISNREEGLMDGPCECKLATPTASVTRQSEGRTRRNDR